MASSADAEPGADVGADSGAGAGADAGPGTLIGSGRAADVYALDERRVLRRFRGRYDVGPEARLMTYLRSHDYPVPEVYAADGRDLVMQRLTGVDMLADLGKRPWLVDRHARTLAQLHDRLHQIVAPDGLHAPFGHGDRVLHLDLHPANVMLTDAGPVVIDWSTAGAGPAGIDVAIASVIMESSEVDDMPRSIRVAALALRGRFIRQFLGRLAPASESELAHAIQHRLKDPNVRPGEAAKLRQMLVVQA